MAAVSPAVNTATTADRDRIWDALAAYYSWDGYDEMSVGEKLTRCSDQVLEWMNDNVKLIEHRDESAALPPPSDIDFGA